MVGQDGCVNVPGLFLVEGPHPRLVVVGADDDGQGRAVDTSGLADLRAGGCIGGMSSCTRFLAVLLLRYVIVGFFQNPSDMFIGQSIKHILACLTTVYQPGAPQNTKLMGYGQTNSLTGMRVWLCRSGSAKFSPA